MTVVRVPVEIGKTYNYLTVTGCVGRKGQYVHWACTCVCGNTCEVPGTLLCGGKRRRVSCGCMKGAVRHRMSYHTVYHAWQAMRYRCHYEGHASYAYYGGRGITVCERWQVFENFAEDMLPTWEKGLTLERIDNSKGYYLENCRWATRGDQMRNTRRNIMVDTPDGRMCVRDAERRFGITEETILRRIKAGLPLDKVFTKGRMLNGRDRKKG